MNALRDGKVSLKMTGTDICVWEYVTGVAGEGDRERHRGGSGDQGCRTEGGGREGVGLLWEAPQVRPSPAPSLPLLRPSPHLVLGQQLAPPVGVGQVVEGEAQVMVTVLINSRGFGSSTR